MRKTSLLAITLLASLQIPIKVELVIFDPLDGNMIVKRKFKHRLETTPVFIEYNGIPYAVLKTDTGYLFFLQLYGLLKEALVR